MTQVSVSEASRNLSHWVNQATYGRDLVVITSHGKPKAVIMGAEVFETFIGVRDYAQGELLTPEQLQQEFGQALALAGYGNREAIVEMVRQVKQDMIVEETVHKNSAKE